MSEKQPKKKKTAGDIVLTVVLIAAVCVFCYAGYNLFHIYTEYKKGTDEYNQKLSERRAASVKSYLMDRGVAASRMFTMGVGEKEPVASNETDAGRADNRRVEFAITANEEMIQDAQQAQ